MDPQPQLVKADERLRLIMMVGFVLFALVGTLFIWFFVQSLNYSEVQPTSELSRDTLRVALSVLTFILTVTLIGFGGYLANISVRTLKSARFPPAGLRVIKDTEVVIGKRARIRGAARLILSVLLIVSGVFFLIVVWWAVNVLLPIHSQEIIT